MNHQYQPSLQSLDEQAVGWQHWRMVITAGMGFFTDAYDLFVIGVVTTLLMPIWHLSATQIALLNGASLAAAALGAIVFGALADWLGRKKMYGVEVLILFVGAILSALSQSYIMLLLARVLIGFGIGGDYPTSAVVASEHANRKNRGYLVLLVFAMQALGLIVGPLFASLLLSLHVEPTLTWRILLGLGALPAASVFYLRRTLHETPRFQKATGAPIEVSRVVCDLVGFELDSAAAKSRFKPQSLLAKPWLRYLIGTASAWFLLDVAFYGNGISSVMILNTLTPHGSLLTHTLLSALIFCCFAVPGYFLAAHWVDRLGRKTLQILGFLMITACYAGIAFIPGVTGNVIAFLLLFGISFFFVNFGPNTTTFLIPSEIFPTSIRAKGHGISAAIGKLGAFLGAFFLPLVLKDHGLSVTMSILAVVSFIGAFATLLVPEMKAVSLDVSEQST